MSTIGSHSVLTHSLPSTAEKTTNAEKAAMWSWRLPVVAIAAKLIITVAINSGESQVVPPAILGFVVLLTSCVGLVCSVGSLANYRQCGLRKIITPALAGLILNSVILFAFAAVFISLKH